MTKNRGLIGASEEAKREQKPLIKAFTAMTNESREAEIEEKVMRDERNAPGWFLSHEDALFLRRQRDDLRARLAAAEQQLVKSAATLLQTCSERDAARRQGIEDAAASHERSGGNPILRKMEADAIRALADKGT